MMIDRRALFARFLGAAGTAAFAAAAVAQADMRGRIVVDAGPLAAKGASASAAAIERLLGQELAAAFAGALPPGSRLIVRIESLSFAPYAGEGGFDLMGMSDSLEGSTTLVGAGGQVLGTYPLRNSLSPAASGSWYAPDAEQRRLAGLCRNYAYWLRRAVRV